MATVQLVYSNNNPITFPGMGLVSLGDGTTVTSDEIDNSTDLFITADIQIKYKTGGTVDANGSVTVFMIRSADGGLTFDESDDNADVLGVFDANTATNDYIISIDLSRIGTLPSNWKIAFRNNSGGTLDSTASNFDHFYSGKKFEVIGGI